MNSLQARLYVPIEEHDGGLRPFLLGSDFLTSQAYRALDFYNPSESSDAYFVLSKDHVEIWFTCSSHVRIFASLPNERAVVLPTGGTVFRQMALV